MSLLVRSKQSAQTECVPALITPSRNNVWIAGSAVANKGVVTIQQNLVKQSPIRAFHQGQHSGESVHLYFEFAPTPSGIASSTQMTPLRSAAMDELSEYAGDITVPIECHRQAQSNSGKAMYESTTQYGSGATVENLARNMIAHDLCLKCTVTHPILSFQPFTAKFTGDDLKNCITRTAGVCSNGIDSKFIQTVSAVAPHNILLHIVKDPASQQHHFYGVTFTQKDSF